LGAKGRIISYWLKQQAMRWIRRRQPIILVLILIAMVSLSPSARAADSGFTQFIASLWPEAQAAGVSRATFDTETRGLEPDYKLPDLISARPSRDRRAVAG